MGNTETRDRQVSLVRRATIWVAAGSLAATAGIGALLGTDHRNATAVPTEGVSPSSPSSTGLTQPTEAPGQSDGSGTVTSGGS